MCPPNKNQFLVALFFLACNLPHMNLSDLTGQRFGCLTVQYREQFGKPHPEHDKSFWFCMCDCGRVLVASRAQLNAGKDDCGKHGISVKHKREYMAWRNMLNRCNNPKHPKFKSYGARGIRVYHQWLSFRRFLADMGPCPAGYSIERHDNDGIYEPSNCSWIPAEEQAHNTRQLLWVRWKGERVRLGELVERFGLKRGTVNARLYVLGWSLEDALTKPVKGQSK